MVDTDVRLIARRILVGQRELLALFKLYLAVSKLTKAHLRTLRVEDERNDLARPLCRCTYLVDAFEVLLVCTMGEVEACAVHSALDERVNNSLRIRCRTLCADNFCLFQHIMSPAFLESLIKCFPWP